MPVVVQRLIALLLCVFVGPAQSASRSFLGRVIPEGREGEVFGLYATTAEPGMARQVEGLRSVRCEAVISRLPMPGPLCFGRGLEITLEFDELLFEGGSAFLMGCVLERFLARHVSINSFTETVLRSVTRGEIIHWPARCGLRPIL